MSKQVSPERLGALKNAWALFRSKDVAWWKKLIPLVGLAYLFWPFDGVSDLVPFLGQLDDAAVLSLLTALFVKLAEPSKKE